MKNKILEKALQLTESKRTARILNEESKPKQISPDEKLKIFNKLKPKQQIDMWIDSSMSKGKNWRPFVVGRKSKSAKYNLEKISLQQIGKDGKAGGVKFYLYNRDGKISLAMGDMAASLISMRKSTNESVELDEAKKGELQQWEFPNERKAKQFLKDIENAGVANGNLMQKNKKQVIIEILPGSPKVIDSAIEKYSKKNGGKQFNQRKSGPWRESVDEAFTSARYGVSVHKPKKTKKLDGLSKDAKGLLASAINFSSSDSGPYADIKNLDNFKQPAFKAAMKFIKTNKSQLGKSAMAPYKELQKYFGNWHNMDESVELDEADNWTLSIDFDRTMTDPELIALTKKFKKHYIGHGSDRFGGSDMGFEGPKSDLLKIKQYIEKVFKSQINKKNTFFASE